MLERFDFGRRETCGLADDVDWFEASGDGSRIVISDHGDLTVIPGGHRPDSDNPDDKVRIDGTRARFMADPVSMWHQAYAEACRIMQHDYWIPDLADVDLDAMADEYRPLLDRITSQAEFGDVLREVFGELGTSHAYVYPGSGLSGASSASGEPPGLLGADTERTPSGWQVTRVVRGESSDPRARSPLSAPGAGVTAGDVLVAVDGQPVGADGPGPLLAGAAGKPVELTVAAAGSGHDGRGPRRSVAIVPLRSDHRLRYLDWVSRKRDQVRELTGGRVGYLHVPDMVSEGWADFHRDLRSEMLRDALVVDVRGNTGGHTSQLVIEKLARRVIGWDVPSGALPSTYPEDAPRGPVVALADECAGSDGDIVTAAIRILQLGPVVGARTWGGVIGYDDLHELVDGTQMTVPRLAFWLDGFGWGVENHGVDPDVELIPTPDDWAAGRDVQLETAVRLALAALRQVTRGPSARPRRPAVTAPAAAPAAVGLTMPCLLARRDMPDVTMPVRQLVWDMDGTLLDSSVAVPAAYVAAVRRLGGPPVSPEQVVASYPIGPAEALLPHLLGRDLAAGESEAYYDELASATVRPYRGVADVLSALRARGHRLAVFTGASHRAAAMLLTGAGIAVDVLVGGDEVRHPKPGR